VGRRVDYSLLEHRAHNLLKGVAETIEHCTATEMHDINHSNHLHLDVNNCLCQGSANLPH
jgi:hypothetical protein